MRRGLRFVPVAALLAVAAELAVFVGVGRLVGFGSAVLLVFAASLLGLVLLRREGMRAWRGFRAAAQAGQPPGPQVTDGLVGLLGALLLAVPGLVTGVVGALLLVPPVRRLTRAGVRRATERRVSSMVAGDLFGPRVVRVRRAAQPTPPGQSPAGPAEPSVVDGGRAIEGEIVEPGR
ncbi:FxsA family protein [Micromonospora sp. NBC_01655]|uniref:FxsA family protein n=1 Tax=Micromonospora sp. NBC_01655 TaxID=2975983 RepID=UPI002259331C|nr:FxsA family protein [Micromonospora sp. NBC_01655]MCX4472389.1 FxsA family protein [Micromonospora sp. NBC_01655]